MMCARSLSPAGKGEDGQAGQGASSRAVASPRALKAVSPRPQVLLLGSGDSGKSTILKQMRLIHSVPFSSQEIESYRQLVFNNITHEMKYLLDAMADMNLEVDEEHHEFVRMVEEAQDLRDGQPFPVEYLEPLRKLWNDPGVQKCWERGNEAAIPEK